MLRFTGPSKLNISPVDLVGIGLFGLLTLAFVFGLVAPLGVRESLYAARVQAAAEEAQRTTALAGDIRSVNEQINGLRSRIAASPLTIRPPDALNERLAGLVALADECGLSVQDLKPGDGVRVRRYYVLPVHLAGQGRYPDTTRFLRLLHERLPDVGLRSFKLSATPDAGARCELDLRWYASPPAVTPAKAESAAVPLR